MTDDEDALLAASRKAYQTNAKLSTAEKSNQQVFLDGTDIIRFEDNDDDAHKCGTESTKPVKQSSIKKQGKQREKPREDLSDAALHALEVTSVTPSRRRSKREIEEVCMHRSFAVPRQVGRSEMVWYACFWRCFL